MSIDLATAELAADAEALRQGELSPHEYATTLSTRIDTVNDTLHAVVSESDRLNRVTDAIAELEETFSDSTARPPLFGVPVGIKDIIHVDGIPTRAGSAVPPELLSGPEASCVSRLRKAGAIVIGKTVTTEFAGAGPGLTRNPHNLDHTPGGSSSGSAAGVAAGLYPLALGTQTSGSVIRPAAFCGVVGLKPSYERIPRDGVIERSSTADHVGMFTQDVEGTALAASILCDEWSSRGEPSNMPTIGIPSGPYLDQASSTAIDSFERTMTVLEEAGCTIVRVSVPTFDAFDALDRRHKWVTDAELALVHQDWYDDYRLFYRTSMVERIETGRTITTGQLAEGRASCLSLRAELDDLMDDNGIDLWSAPAAVGPAPRTIRGTGDPVMNGPWTHSGLPVITLPSDTTQTGLPLGTQFIAAFNADERLLSWARMIEAAL